MGSTTPTSEGMEDKFYKPDLTEFHYGFKFELFMPTEKYLPFVFGEDNITHKELIQYQDDLDKIAHAITRVKFLDSTDIESEGWVIYGHSDFKSMGNFKNFDIIKLYAENEYAIRKITDQTKDAEILFRGTIKNINELRVIQKMIGIK